ncbi:MAG: acyclic terpene utilization AtuA family protein [Micromonosporaceae bacterium]|nr:acyclic terpene utilization AtuA family protein [Micromonosporaceae bacterium]
MNERSAGGMSAAVVRLGGCLAGWGDWPGGAVPMVERGGVDYLGYDFLSELTMTILAKRRARLGPHEGYVPDVARILAPVLPAAGEGRTRVVTNAGGMYPRGALRKVARALVEAGFPDTPVAEVTGDDVLGRLDTFVAEGVELTDHATGMHFREYADRAVFAHAYLGARPVQEALAAGAHVVTAGRVTDAALFLGPILHETGWRDLDRLATGLVVGHLLECSGMVTGGSSNFWRDAVDPWNPGYPVAEVGRDGSVVITKTPGTGGLVSRGTVIEQLLYEIHDPAAIVSPDVVADITAAHVGQVGRDRVAVSGVRGTPAPDTLKLLIGYRDGWTGEGTIMFSWPEALDKARRAEQILRHRIDAEALPVRELLFEYIGVNALHGPTAPIPPDPNEVMLRVCGRFDRAEPARALFELILPLFSMAPATPAGFAGRPAVRETVALAVTALPAALVSPRVDCLPAREAAEEE